MRALVFLDRTNQVGWNEIVRAAPARDEIYGHQYRAASLHERDASLTNLYSDDFA